MSTKAVLLWVILAIVLGLVALALLRAPSPAATPTAYSPTSASHTPVVPVGQRILDFAPSSVTRLTITHPAPDASVDVIDRVSAQTGDTFDPRTATRAFGNDAEWLLTIHPATHPAPATPASTQPWSAWPVTAASMSGLMRRLADTQAVAEPAATASLGDNPTVLTLTFRDGSTSELRFARRTLAGTGMVEISDPAQPGADLHFRRAIVSDELERALGNPGPRAWRDPRIFAGLAVDASRIHLRTPTHHLTLAKVDGRWMLREPAKAPVEAAAVNKLLGTLANIQIIDFLDDPSTPHAGKSALNPDDTGVATPAATVEIEADRRVFDPAAGPGGEPKVMTAKLELAIGLPADTEGARVFAQIDGQRTVIIDAQALPSLSLEPGRYIWPHPTNVAGPDIGQIAFYPLELRATTPKTIAADQNAQTFERSLSRWVKVTPAGRELLADSDLTDVERLVSFLTGSDQPISATAPPTPPGVPTNPNDRPVITLQRPAPSTIEHPTGTLSLRSLAGAPLETIYLSVGGTPKSPTMTFQTGDVYRTYPLEAVPAVLRRFAAMSGTPSQSR